MVEGYHWEQDSHDGYGQVLIIAGKKKNQSGRNSSETKIIFCKKAGKNCQCKVLCYLPLKTQQNVKEQLISV